MREAKFKAIKEMPNANIGDIIPINDEGFATKHGGWCIQYLIKKGFVAQVDEYQKKFDDMMGNPIETLNNLTDKKQEEFKDLGDLINTMAHEAQPHTILGKRGQTVMTLKDIQISECFLRGMLDGGTYYAMDKEGELTHALDTTKLNYHHLIDIIYKVKWLEDFDPVAIVQCASVHLEKVLGIFPNIDKLEENKNE